ncbi:MAG: ASCH domain-containing protein [archaeon]
MKVPVISLRQPIAELILRGEKTIETRSRKANLSGTIYLHASLGKSWPARVGLDVGSLPRGCIVGKVEVMDRKVYSSLAEWSADAEKHLAGLPKKLPMYGYVLSHPVRIPPFPCKGQLGLPFWVEWKE